MLAILTPFNSFPAYVELAGQWSEPGSSVWQQDMWLCEPHTAGGSLQGL